MVSISVLIPCYNDGRWLVECITSVERQSIRALETIVVDDGSNDSETLTLLAGLQSHPGLLLLKKPNEGVSSARNMALSAAKGDYVLFLDADDYLEDNALEVMVAAAEAAKSEFIAAGWRDVTDDGRPIRTTVPERGSNDPYTNIIAGFGLPVGGVLVKLRPELRFRETMPWEAQDYFLDYVCAGGGVVFIDDIVINRRQGDRAERLTNKLNHFEPFRMGQFFAERRETLLQLGMATVERVAALDQRILDSVQALVRQKRVAEAEILAKKIQRPLLEAHQHYRPGSFAWTFRWGGFPAARLFVGVNRLIGRA
jgi:glycosyltransferase involved in cell wall biosynthesis